jgi:hypothetical protein
VKLVRADVGVSPSGCFGDRRLLEVLRELDEDRLRRLRGVITESDASSIVVVLGPDLPWVAGVRYLAEAAPALFIPTTRTLDLTPSLAAAALAKHIPAALIDVDARLVLVPLRAALPLSRARLVA